MKKKRGLGTNLYIYSIFSFWCCSFFSLSIVLRQLLCLCLSTKAQKIFLQTKLLCKKSSVCYQIAWLIHQHSLKTWQLWPQPEWSFRALCISSSFFFLKAKNINSKSITLKGSWICFDFLWLNFKQYWSGKWMTARQHWSIMGLFLKKCFII